MINIKVMLVVLTLALLPLAQTSQEPKSGASPKVSDPQILELPLVRESAPVILFERALKDKDGRCKVHHHPLEVAVVPIIYGLLPGLDEEYYEAERRKFPNAITRYEAGCLVMSPKQAKVLQCQQCLKARAVYEGKRRVTS